MSIPRFKTQFDGDGWRGCGHGCEKYSCNWQQTVLSTKEIASVFFKSSEQERIFHQDVETLEELGVTHACYKCGHWFFGMSAEGTVRMAARAVAADLRQEQDWPMIYGTRQTSLNEYENPNEFPA